MFAVIACNDGSYNHVHKNLVLNKQGPYTLTIKWLIIFPMREIEVYIVICEFY